MRISHLSVAICLAACGAAHAQAQSKYDCAWNAVPGAEASFNGGPPISDDALVQAMQTCGFALTGDNAARLGLYFDMRHHRDASASALRTAYPASLEELDAATSSFSEAETAEIVQMGKTRSISQSLLQHLADITRSAGIPESDTAARAAAQRYLAAVVTIGDLEAQS
jgi:hypothetical protein